MRARKYPDLRWQAYVASALMEWQHDRKDQIPRNIFELGLKSFLGEAQYVEQYVQFLVGEWGACTAPGVHSSACWEGGGLEQVPGQLLDGSDWW